MGAESITTGLLPGWKRQMLVQFPMLYIEPVTRQEIEKYTALEKKLQGNQSKIATLEEFSSLRNVP